jgi:hypothetical protein
MVINNNSVVYKVSNKCKPYDIGTSLKYKDPHEAVSNQ